MRAYYHRSVRFLFENGRAARDDLQTTMRRAKAYQAKSLERAERTLSRMPDYKRKRLIALHREIGRDVGRFMNCVADKATDRA